MAARIAAPIKRQPLITFFVLSYAITWPGWWLEAQGIQAGIIPGYFGPALAAIVVTIVTEGRPGLADLLGRLFRWRVPLRWYLVAVLVPAASVLSVAAIPALTSGGSTGFDPAPLRPILPELAVVLVFGTLYGVMVAAGEELGWRGYALPKLLARHNALVSSLIVGIVWGLWHLPVGFLFESGNPALVDSLVYGLGVDLAAVIYTWLYRHTRGSVLIAALFHSAYDIFLIVGGQVAQVTGLEFSFRIHVLVLAGIAALLVVLAGPELGPKAREPAKDEPQP
ncbi:MAG: type II CAAX endopeptidase family protein [Anaerolineae bacterium]